MTWLESKCSVVGVCIAILLPTLGCHSWDRNVSVDGVQYKKFRTIEKNKGTDRVYSIGLLEETTEIDGVAYNAWLHRHDNGVVAGGLVAWATSINGVDIPARTWIACDRSGFLQTCSFPRNVTIQGYVCSGTGGGAKGSQVSFFRSGKLKQFFSPENIRVQGVLCKGGLLHVVGLHENGKLMVCTAAEDVTVGGKTFKAGTEVRLDNEGQARERSWCGRSHS